MATERLLLSRMISLTLLLAALPPASAPAAADIPTLSVSELPAGSKPLLLPTHLPGYDLRVLDERKPITLQTADGKVEVRLPIYFYFPADERREGLRLIREAADELRRAAHNSDPGGADLESTLERLEHGLDLLGAS
jgi:hypothetical protein